MEIIKYLKTVQVLQLLLSITVPIVCFNLL